MRPSAAQTVSFRYSTKCTDMSLCRPTAPMKYAGIAPCGDYAGAINGKPSIRTPQDKRALLCASIRSIRADVPFDFLQRGMAHIFTFYHVNNVFRHVFGMVAHAFDRFGDKHDIDEG